MATYTEQELRQALRRCEAEPIQHIGSIQRHGAMLVLAADDDHKVVQASENIHEFLGLCWGDVIGKPLAALLVPSALVEVEQLFKRRAGVRSSTVVIALNGSPGLQSVLARGFFARDLPVLELIDERHTATAPHFGDLLNSMEHLELSSYDDAEIGGYFGSIAAIVRNMNGYDRVMVYRFDANWDGEVIAESRTEAAQSFLGNHFPASDIPPPARMLYTKNLTRQVVDVEAQPVAVMPPLNPASGLPLDLTHASLRSLSPIHIEYLRNMGVRASMSISLLQNGRLWGLIACHHMTSVQLSLEAQEAAAFISKLASAKLSTIETLRQRSLGSDSIRIVGELLKYVPRDPNDSVVARLLPELLKLLDATGVVTVIDGKYYVAGKTPAEDELAELLAWVGGNPAAETLACDDLGKRFPVAAALAGSVAGLLASPVTPDMRNCIVWLRAEKLQTSIWAGNPEKIMSQGAAGDWKLSPRKSFSAWNETWRGRCAPWAKEEVDIAAMLASFLSEGFKQKSQIDQLEAQLRQAQKMEALGTLAGGIAHDFNNILANILGNTALARQDLIGNPSALQSLDEISKAGTRARDLVRQILSFSRRNLTQKKPVDLTLIVDESVRLLRATLPLRIALDVQYAAVLPQVLADSTQIQQIIINLVTNAVQALRGERGHVAIRLNAVTVDATMTETQPALRAIAARHAGHTVQMVVSDDGPGMSAATMERVFEPFFTTKAVDEGTGLGLSVVHGIVQTHEGVIVVDSKPGKGSTFTIYLPVIGEPTTIVDANPVADANAISATTSIGGQRILYIDDDDALVFLIQRSLERRGIHVSGYTDQREALAALRANPAAFDLVVTDYNMPGMSGLDVAREVRAIRPDLPLAIASGFIDETLRAEADGAGVRELIFKANAVEDLCDAFMRLAESFSAGKSSTVVAPG